MTSSQIQHAWRTAANYETHYVGTSHWKVTI